MKFCIKICIFLSRIIAIIIVSSAALLAFTWVMHILLPRIGETFLLPLFLLGVFLTGFYNQLKYVRGMYGEFTHLTRSSNLLLTIGLILLMFIHCALHIAMLFAQVFIQCRSAFGMDYCGP